LERILELGSNLLASDLQPSVQRLHLKHHGSMSGALEELRSPTPPNHPRQVTGATIMFSKDSKLSRRRSTVVKASVLAAAISTATMSLAIPAYAEGRIPQATIDYQDLNLTRGKDVQRLYSRLKHAAKQVCASWDGRQQYERTQFRQCYDEALTNAVGEIDVPQLSALHQSNGGELRVAQQRRAQNDS
jgi:UrcA family protein